MNLCSNKHDEVCYEGRICPVCDLRDDMQETIDDLEEEINGLKKEME